MKILFGKPRLEYCPCANGLPDTADGWIQIDTPRENTTSLETTEGNDLEAIEDGGVVVDRVSLASSYALTFELYKKKGEAFPLSDKESSGVVSGEYAIRVTSDVDSDAPGFQLDRCVVRTARRYSPDDTYRKQFTFLALKPSSGETIKEVENTLMKYSHEGGTKTVSVINYGNLTLEVSDEWITATASGQNITVVVPRNENKTPRSGSVTITDTETGTITDLTIEQAKSPNFLKTLSDGLLLTALGHRISLRT